MAKLSKFRGYLETMEQAKVAELVDAHDSKSCTERCVGSIPTFGTDAELSEKKFDDSAFLFLQLPDND